MGSIYRGFVQGRDRDSWTAVEQRDKQRAESFFFLYTTKRDIGFFLRRGFSFLCESGNCVIFYSFSSSEIQITTPTPTYLSISFYFGKLCLFYVLVRQPVLYKSCMANNSTIFETYRVKTRVFIPRDTLMFVLDWFRRSDMLLLT